jgi:hypothetical protein
MVDAYHDLAHIFCTVVKPPGAFLYTRQRDTLLSRSLHSAGKVFNRRFNPPVVWLFASQWVVSTILPSIGLVRCYLCYTLNISFVSSSRAAGFSPCEFSARSGRKRSAFARWRASCTKRAALPV